MSAQPMTQPEQPMQQPMMEQPMQAPPQQHMMEQPVYMMPGQVPENPAYEIPPQNAAMQDLTQKLHQTLGQESEQYPLPTHMQEHFAQPPVQVQQEEAVSVKDRLMQDAKEPAIVAGLAFLASQPFVINFIAKYITSAQHEGQTTTVGLLLLAVLVGLSFYVGRMFLK